MNPVMRVIWLFFMAKKKLGLTKLGRPARAPAKPTKTQLRGLTIETKELGGFPLHTGEERENQRANRCLSPWWRLRPADRKAALGSDRKNCSRETASTVMVPRYGLASRYNVDDAFEFLELVRKEVAKTDLPVVLAGDSAGGGLALAIAQLPAWQKLTKKLILIAPWVDSEWSYEDFEVYENRDPWLLSQSLRYIAIVWSNRGDYRRLEVSLSGEK